MPDIGSRGATRDIRAYCRVTVRVGKRTRRGMMLMIGRCSGSVLMLDMSIGAGCSDHALMHGAAKQHGRRGKSLGGNCQHHEPHQRGFKDWVHPAVLDQRFPNKFKGPSEGWQAYAEDLSNSNSFSRRQRITEPFTALT